MPAPTTVEAVLIETTVFSYTNAIRSEPRRWAEKLLEIERAERRKKPDGNPSLTIGGWNLIEAEGLASLNDLMRDISSGKIKAGRPLNRDPRLDDSARLHLKRLLVDPDLGHTRPGGSIEKDYQSCGLLYGSNCTAFAENLAFGYWDPLSIACGLVIDDGVSGRGHRYNMFDADFNAVGIAFGTGTNKAKYVCVMNFGQV